MTEEIITRCKKIINESDAILIGAGSGLSAAAGLVYSGDRFTKNFKDFIDTYKLTDMYSAGFYPFETPEERWAYWSRHIKINRYDHAPGPVYKNLLNLVKNKPHFVVTTNVDGLFVKAGLDPKNIFYTQGDYGKLQCPQPCHTTLYSNKNMVFKMVEEQFNCKTPSHLIPKCPNCGKVMKPHLRIDSTFIENENWQLANKNYSQFITENSEKKLVLLEFGIGYNTPGIIRFPFEKMTASFPNTHLIRVNIDSVETSIPLEEKCVLIKTNIAQFMNSLV